MGLFDFFKKKEEEPHYDPSNIKIKDLRTGFVFDYDMKSWEVKKAWDYAWDSGGHTFEFQADCGSETIYIDVEENDELEISVWQKIKIRRLHEDLPEIVQEEGKPPSKLVYGGVTYYRDSQTEGECAEEGSKEWFRLIVWDYYDDDEKFFLNVEQWGEDEFEAAVGVKVEEFAFSNILPIDK